MKINSDQHTGPVHWGGLLRPVIMCKTIMIVSLLLSSIFCWVTAKGEDQHKVDRTQGIWSELLQRTPYPYTLPLPVPKATPIDGTYAKFEKKEGEPVHCLRCPDYAPEGGLWKLNLNKGVFRIFHKVTGWKDIGSVIVSGDQLILANDPVCHETFGVYRWKLEEGKLILTVIDDKCAIGLRAMNLTNLPWLSCQPPNKEAAITEHWPIPPECDE